MSLYRDALDANPQAGSCQVPLSAVMESVAVLKPFRRGQQIHGREGPGEHLYRIVSGMARDCVLLADGRRQILDLLLPGDFFGFTDHAEPEVTVEAIVDGTLVASYPWRRLETLAESDPRLVRLLREIAFDAVSRSRGRMLILGQLNARERVGCFLVEMAERLSDGPAAALVLPMSRYDIADYLALSVETVCRVLTDLKGRGAITFTGTNRVKILDRCALQAGGRPRERRYAQSSARQEAAPA